VGTYHTRTKAIARIKVTTRAKATVDLVTATKTGSETRIGSGTRIGSETRTGLATVRVTRVDTVARVKGVIRIGITKVRRATSRVVVPRVTTRTSRTGMAGAGHSLANQATGGTKVTREVLGADDFNSIFSIGY
jgi:hypothetical protein